MSEHQSTMPPLPPWLRWYAHAVRWAFRRLYHEFAWGYDAVAFVVSAGLWADWIRAVRPFLRGRILEIGCGTGYLQASLADQVAWGLDASPQMLRQARRRLRRAGLPLRLVRGQSQALPCPTATIDSLVATFPAEYIVAPATARELRRVLAPNGQLLIIDGGQFTRDGWYERLTDLAFRATLQGPTKAVEAPISLSHLANLEQVAFVFRAEWLTVGPSRVLLIKGIVADGSAR